MMMFMFLQWRMFGLCIAMDIYLPVGVTDQDHLLKQFSIRSGFGYNLPEHQQQFFNGVVLKRKHKTDDCHQQTRQLLTVQDHDDDFLQRLCLGFYLPLFCSHKQHKAAELILQHSEHAFMIFSVAFLPKSALRLTSEGGSESLGTLMRV